VDGQHAIGEARAHLGEPAVESLGLLRIAAPLEFDAAKDFGKDRHADTNLLDFRSGDPLRDSRMGVFHVRTDEGFLQRRAKLHRLAGFATQGFGDRPDETGVRPAGLDLKAHEPPRARALAMGAGCFPLRFSGHARHSYHSMFR
jgi:hypothetical protein